VVIIAVATLLVLAIAFYQVLQGPFSALIMALLTVLCAAVSLGFYEDAAQLLMPHQPAYAHAGAMLALLFVPLLVLRILLDRFLPQNVLFGVWTNRIVGAAFGLITGTVLVGMLAIIAQLLPLGGTVLGYQPFDDSLQHKQRLAPFYPDESVAAMARMLSAGGLSGERTFGGAHDDLVLEAFCARNTAGKDGRVDAPADSLRVQGYRDAPAPEPPEMKSVPPDPLIEKGVKQRLIEVRVEITRDAREPEKSPLKDWWLLPATHFRLVTQKGRSHYPVAYRAEDPNGRPVFRPADAHEGRAAIATLIAELAPAGSPALVTWFYRIPADEEPRFLTFRRVAMGELKKVDHWPAALAKPATKPAPGPGAASAGRSPSPSSAGSTTSATSARGATSAPGR